MVRITLLYFEKELNFEKQMQLKFLEQTTTKILK
jgi:hypothetical protein